MRIVIENLRQDMSEDEIREVLSPVAPVGKIVLIKEGSMPTAVIEMEMTRTQAEVLAMRIDGLIYKGQELRAWAPLWDEYEARPQSTSATAPPSRANSQARHPDRNLTFLSGLHQRTPLRCPSVSLSTPVMTLNREPKYPNRRAYVLKLRSDARPDTLAGRLENLVTGRQREFASSRELLDSIASDLEASADQRSADPARQ